MKKLSIVLALIMALSCFSLTAFAEEASTEAAATTEAAQAAKVVINVELIAVDGTVVDTIVLNYEAAPGTTLKAADIIAAVKSRLGDEQVDLDEYVINETVIAYDDVDLDGVEDNEYAFTSTKVVSGESYTFKVIAHEIDDVANLANTIGEQLAKIDWAGITKANVALINQLINGAKAAVDSLVNAEWPEADKKDEAKEEATTVETVETPDTGVSAVAGAAVVVLALSATTAVVLRKKED